MDNTQGNEIENLFKYSTKNKEFLEKARDLYKKFSLKTPFDIEGYARALGLDISDEELKFTHSGKLKGENIIVNSIHTSNRKRFTTAHELAHYLLGHGDQTLDYVNNRDLEAEYTPEQLKDEEEADSLAAAIIMPQDKLKEYVNEFKQKNNIDTLDTRNAEKLVVSIAKHFEVSKKAAVLRIKELGYVGQWTWLNV